MHRTCIAIVDATRARLFTFDRTAEVDGVHEELSERTDLVNPARLDAKFARSIIAAIERTVEDTAARRIIVCASPRMLGALRAADLRHEGLVIDELARDYVKLTPSQIHDELVAHGLLPTSPPRLGLVREG